ncbi:MULTISPECIES: PspC domain-containing protein [Paenibacillus]|uniref:PspC domain-containing protein n=1 Tax=Paenibacillus TaxID=44249 RepID=UPI00035D7E06|nr:MULTISPECIES: PspC domain-containing protein [Paenibacillus]
MRPKLYRSAHDRILTGLTGGLAQYFQINPTLLRVLFILSIPFTGAASILIYLVAIFIVPKEPPMYRPFEYGPYDQQPEDRYGPGHTYGGYWGTSQNAYEPNMYDAPHKTNSRDFGKNRPPYEQPDPVGRKKADLDSMMEDIEKKALRKEVEELRKKIAQIEKGEQ